MTQSIYARQKHGLLWRKWHRDFVVSQIAWIYKERRAMSCGFLYAIQFVLINGKYYFFCFIIFIKRDTLNAFNHIVNECVFQRNVTWNIHCCMIYEWCWFTVFKIKCIINPNEAYFIRQLMKTCNDQTTIFGRLSRLLCLLQTEVSLRQESNNLMIVITCAGGFSSFAHIRQRSKTSSFIAVFLFLFLFLFIKQNIIKYLFKINIISPNVHIKHLLFNDYDISSWIIISVRPNATYMTYISVVWWWFHLTCCLFVENITKYWRRCTVYTFRSWCRCLGECVLWSCGVCFLQLKTAKGQADKPIETGSYLLASNRVALDKMPNLGDWMLLLSTDRLTKNARRINCYKRSLVQFG